MNKEYEKFEKWFHETQIENSLFPNVMKLFDTSKDILREAYHAGTNTAECAKLLTEQDYKYNKQTNELIARHAEQLDVAAEFCRQYQIENAQLKESTAWCYEKNLDLNLENFGLKAKNEFIEDAARDYERENIFLKSENQTLNVCVENSEQAYHELVRKNNHLQFLLDSVMLEFCPDEMTDEQMENWKKHQQKSNLEIEL